MSASRGILSVPGLEALLGSFVAEECEQRIDEHRGLMEMLGQHDEVVPLVRGVLADKTLIGRVASESYRHVNEFDKIVLVGNDDPRGFRLTLHLWLPPYPAAARRQEMIHGHRFCFWSTIVTGTLSSEEFEQVEPDHGQSDVSRRLRRYRYTPEASRSVDFSEFYQFDGYANLVSIGRPENRRGESYYLDASVIHRVILPLRQTTCSLVLRGPRLRPYSHVYNATYPSRDTYRRNKMFTARELSGKLAQLLAALEADQS